MINSTAKIAYAYISRDHHSIHEDNFLAPTPYLFLPDNETILHVTIEFGLIGLNDDHFYSLFTRFYDSQGNEVGYPNDITEPNKYATFFAKTGEFALSTSSTERFRVKGSGYYRVEITLYEYGSEYKDKDLTTLCDSANIAHTYDIYVAIASEWSE